MIVGPNGQVMAGPMGVEEGVVYADCNLEAGITQSCFTTLPGTITVLTFSN